MTLDDGTVTTGDYDLVPILEKFCEQHPDFSYKGARAVLAFTGYEGILGYRTSLPMPVLKLMSRTARQLQKLPNVCGSMAGSLPPTAGDTWISVL